MGTLYDHDTFVVKSAHDGDPILSTKELQALIEKRIAWIATQENTTQKQFYEHAGKCIDITWKALRVDFNPTVKYSIASVAEFLASAIDKFNLLPSLERFDARSHLPKASTPRRLKI